MHLQSATLFVWPTLALSLRPIIRVIIGEKGIVAAEVAGGSALAEKLAFFSSNVENFSYK